MPISCAFGKKSAITRHWVKNDRLNHAGYLWAFASLRASTEANALYRRRREPGDWHAAAQRNLFDRIIRTALPLPPEARALRRTVRLPDTAARQGSGSLTNQYALLVVTKAADHSLKTELIKPRRPWKTLSDVELATAEYVDWYNHRRLHGEIGHVPPIEYENNHYLATTKPQVTTNI